MNARLRHTYRRHRTSAGALKGKGGYGCGFFPSIRCEGETAVRPDVLSKYMDMDDAHDEYNQTVKIRKIDPYQHYFIYPLEKPCKPAKQTTEEAKENPLKSCESVEPDTAGLLQFHYGGPSWNSFSIVPDRLSSFMRSWLQLFNAIEYLHENRLAHMDIKTPNIVCTYDPESKTFHNRIIDFGLSIDFDTFPSNDPKYTSLFGETDYFCWPFEVHFLHKPFTADSITESAVNDFYKENVMYHSNQYPTDIYYSAYKKSQTVAVCKELFKDFSKKSEKSRIEAIAKGCDVYALGRTLSTMYTTITRHTPYIASDIQKNGSSKKRESVRIGNDDYKDLYDAKITKHVEEDSLPFFALVRKMMDPDPFKRLTIQSAKKEFMKLPLLNITGHPLLPPSPPVSPTESRKKSRKMKRRRS